MRESATMSDSSLFALTLSSDFRQTANDFHNPVFASSCIALEGLFSSAMEVHSCAAERCTRHEVRVAVTWRDANSLLA